MRQQPKPLELCETCVDLFPWQAESHAHALAPVPRRAVLIGGDGEENQDGYSLQPKPLEPAVVKQPTVQPAEAALRLADPVGVRRRGPHFVLRPVRARRRSERLRLRRVSCSWDSLSL